jgi:Mg-chelatase subunit ChlD
MKGLVCALVAFWALADVSAQCNLLVNGDFEQPAESGAYNMLRQDQVPGWKTTAGDGIIELWRNLTPAHSGKQLCEIDANTQATLYQDIKVLPGSTLHIAFSHRGRATYETLTLLAGPVAGKPDTLGRFTTGTSQWVRYEVKYTVPDKVTSIRVAWRSEVPGSVGNLLDNCSVSLAEGSANITMTVSNDVTIRRGESVTLKATFNLPEAVERVNWLGSGQENMDSAEITVSPDSSVTYLVRAWDVCGKAIATKKVSVTVKQVKTKVAPEATEPSFVDNNILLVLDISSSMAQQDRLKLMRQTVQELMSRMGPRDRLGVVVFNEKPVVFLTPGPLTDAARRQLLQKLEVTSAYGASRGQQALEFAYTLSESQFIEGGNNQVYLVSDGGFEYADRRFARQMKQRKKQGIELGFVAIQPRESTIGLLEKTVKLSGGSVVVIKSAGEVQALSREVMESARR